MKDKATERIISKFIKFYTVTYGNQKSLIPMVTDVAIEEIIAVADKMITLLEE